MKGGRCEAALVFNMKRDPERELYQFNASSDDAAESSNSTAHGSSRAGASSSDYHINTLHTPQLPVIDM